MRRFETREVTVREEVEIDRICDGCGAADAYPGLIPVAIEVNEGGEFGGRDEYDYCDGCLVGRAPLLVAAGSRAELVVGEPDEDAAPGNRSEADILAAELAAERDWVQRALPVLRYVSAGRRFVDVEPYPDAVARALLGELDWSAGMVDGACTCDAVTDVEHTDPTCIAAACVIARVKRGTDRG